MKHSRWNSKLFIVIRLFVFMVLIFSLLGLWVTTAQAAGTVSICDRVHLTSALSGGGTVTFSCSGTIMLTATIEISSNTTLDGAGQSVILTSAAVRLFYVDPGVTFNLKNISVENVNFDDDGTIENAGGTMNVTGVVFSGNHAWDGGALYNSGGTMTVTNSTFSNNSSDDYGGGIFNDYGTLTVTNSTFSGNSANEGGAIYSDGYSSSDLANVVVANSTFSGNSVSTGDSGGGGGAIYNTYYSNLHVTNSTFSGNSAPYPDTNASGIQNYEDATVTLKNTILVNSASSVNCYNFIGTWTDGGGNLEDGSSCGFSGTSRNNTNPLLGTLGSYGGSTQTFPLLPGSPAIDAGVSATCSASVNSYGAGGNDQRGITRPYSCDIGAFESQGFTLTKTGGDNQTTPVSTAFTNPLALTVTSAHSEPVNGGKVTFTPPTSGTSAALTGSPATISSATVSVTATANATAGSYNVTASAAGATSVYFALTNRKAATTTMLGSSLNPSNSGQSVTFTATILPSAATGTVTFQDGGADIPGCVGVGMSLGQATCDTSTLSAGTHTITAVYSGDLNDSGSTGTLSPNQQVNCASALNVSNNTDNGLGSLRQAIADVCAGGTITFASSLSGGTISLSTTLELGKDMTIDGSALASQVTISGNNAVRVFLIDNGVTARLDSLTITHGSTANTGGGIYNAGSLTVTNSTVAGNHAGQGGAGILNENSGTLTVTNSTLTGNTTDTIGGGIYNNIGTLTVANSTLQGNSAVNYGGGIFTWNGSLTLKNSTLSGNSAGANKGGGIFIHVPAATVGMDYANT
ncbi:MAG: choice-of-anchor Q domain-containing protein, partial [Anaerolineales bacterium]